MNTDSQVAINSLMEGIAQYVDYKVSTTPYVKTEMGKIVSSTLTDGKWLHKVAIRNMEYNDIKSVGNLKFNNNSIVYLFIPNGQYNNMFILGQLDNTDVNIKGGSIDIGNGSFIVDNTGKMTSKNLDIILSKPNGRNLAFNANGLSFYNDEYFYEKTDINNFGMTVTDKDRNYTSVLKSGVVVSNNINSTIIGADGVTIMGNLSVMGTKNRIVNTDTYGKRALNAVESAEAYFSDLGTIKCNEEGLGIVMFEDIFSETVDLNKDYNVQITQLTEYNGWVEKQKDKFIIHSNPNAEFDWVVYCKQKDYSDIRLEKKGD